MSFRDFSHFACKFFLRPHLAYFLREPQKPSFCKLLFTFFYNMAKIMPPLLFFRGGKFLFSYQIDLAFREFYAVKIDLNNAERYLKNPRIALNTVLRAVTKKSAMIR